MVRFADISELTHVTIQADGKVNSYRMLAPDRNQLQHSGMIVVAMDTFLELIEQTVTLNLSIHDLKLNGSLVRKGVLKHLLELLPEKQFGDEQCPSNRTFH